MFYGLSGEDFNAPAILKGFNQYSSSPQPAVAEIQRALVLLEYLSPTQKSGKSSIDGVWGPQTKAAYKAATGTEQVSIASLAVLFQRFVEKGKQSVVQVTPSAPPKDIIPEPAYIAPDTTSAMTGKSDKRIFILAGAAVLIGVGLYFYMSPKGEKAVQNRGRRL